MVLPLSVISGVWVGSQILQLMFAVSGSGMEVWSEVFFLIYFLCTLLYVWGTWHSGGAAKASIKAMLNDQLKQITLIGVGAFCVVRNAWPALFRIPNILDRSQIKTTQVVVSNYLYWGGKLKIIIDK